MTKAKFDGKPSEKDDEWVSVDGMFSKNPRAKLIAELDAKREVLTDEEAIAMARKSQLRLSDFLLLTGIEPIDGEWDMYRLSPPGVEFVGLDWDQIRSAAAAFPVEAAKLIDAPTLRFPCTPSELLEFVDDPDTIPGHFTLPVRFREAVGNAAGQSTPSSRRRSEGLRELQRRSAIWDEIEAAIDRLPTDQYDARDVMRELKTVAGHPRRLIVEATPNGIIWRPDIHSKPRELDLKNLTQMLKRRSWSEPQNGR